MGLHVWLDTVFVSLGSYYICGFMADMFASRLQYWTGMWFTFLLHNISQCVLIYNVFKHWDCNDEVHSTAGYVFSKDCIVQLPRSLFTVGLQNG